MADSNQAVEEFFGRYASALLARDEKAMAKMYAVPSLILFPGQTVLMTDVSQTEAFFASARGQYEGVDDAGKQIRIMSGGELTVGDRSGPVLQPVPSGTLCLWSWRSGGRLAR